MKQPYLGAIYKEANKHEIFQDDSTTEEGAEDQLMLQICNMLVIIDKQQPGSPKWTKEL